MNMYLIDLLNESGNYSQEVQFKVTEFIETNLDMNSKGFKKYLKTLKGSISKETYNDMKNIWLKLL